MHGTVSMLLFHAALRLVDIPDGVGGTEGKAVIHLLVPLRPAPCVCGLLAAGIKASRSRPPEYIGRIQLPHDYVSL